MNKRSVRDYMDRESNGPDRDGNIHEYHARTRTHGCRAGGGGERSV
jgi:hypothetical protein